MYKMYVISTSKVNVYLFCFTWINLSVFLYFSPSGALNKFNLIADGVDKIAPAVVHLKLFKRYKQLGIGVLYSFFHSCNLQCVRQQNIEETLLTQLWSIMDFFYFLKPFIGTDSSVFWNHESKIWWHRVGVTSDSNMIGVFNTQVPIFIPVGPCVKWFRVHCVRGLLDSQQSPCPILQAENQSGAEELCSIRCLRQGNGIKIESNVSPPLSPPPHS